MGEVNTLMGDRFSALLVSLMALQLTLVDRNPFRPCFSLKEAIEEEELIFPSNLFHTFGASKAKTLTKLFH